MQLSASKKLLVEKSGREKKFHPPSYPISTNTAAAQHDMKISLILGLHAQTPTPSIFHCYVHFKVFFFCIFPHFFIFKEKRKLHKHTNDDLKKNHHIKAAKIRPIPRSRSNRIKKLNSVFVYVHLVRVGGMESLCMNFSRTKKNNARCTFSWLQQQRKPANNKSNCEI